MTGKAITILVGTDHHPFTRMVAWADARQRSHPEDLVTVQYGSSRPPEVARGLDLMTPDELRTLVARSDIVVTHGGPGTIMDTRSAGHRPVVVARNPGLGEHVDNHQMLFAAWAAGKGLVRLLDGPQELDALVEELGEEGTRDSSPTGHSTEATARRLERLLAGLAQGRPPTAVDATTVLHVSGPDRAATAMLLPALAPRSEVVVLGDAARLWEEGVLADEPCGCGELFSSCPFWTSVGERAFGGWANVDVERLLTLEQSLRRLRSFPDPRRRRRAELRLTFLEYSTCYRRLFDAAREVSGAAVVVDLDGSPMRAHALSHNRHLDLRALHLRGLDGRDGEARTQAVQDRWALRALESRGVPLLQVSEGDVAVDGEAVVRRAWSALRLPDRAGPADNSTAVPPSWSAHAYVRKDA